MPTIPYYSDTVLKGDETSDTAIICLWSRKEHVAQCLDTNSYAFIGQLYSKQYGLEILTRNVLALPSIRHLVVTGIDLNDASPGLLNLFKHGVEEDGTICNTDITLHESIIPHVDTLRERVTVHDCRRSNNFEELQSYIENLDEKEPHGKRIVLDLPEVVAPTRFPTDFSGYKIRDHTFRKTWKKLLRYILKFGIFHPGKQRLSAYNVIFHIIALDQKDEKILGAVSKEDILFNSHIENHSSVYMQSLECWEEIRRLVKTAPTNEHITVHIGTAFLEEDTLEAAIETVGKSEVKLRDPDPHGNILLRVENEEIRLLHLNQNGKVIDEFRGTSKKELFQYIEREMKISLIDHALDIGAEVQKAVIALEKGIEYDQDRKIKL